MKQRLNSALAKVFRGLHYPIDVILVYVLVRRPPLSRFLRYTIRTKVIHRESASDSCTVGGELW